MARQATAIKRSRSKRSASSTAEFKANMPLLLRDSWLTLLTRFGHLLEIKNIRTIEDAVAAHLEKNNKAELPQAHGGQPFLGYSRFISQVSSFVQRGLNMLGSNFKHNLTMVKAKTAEVYSFQISAQGWQLVLGPSSIPGAEHAFETNQPFLPTINLLRDLCKIDPNISVGIDMQKLFVEPDYEQAQYHKESTVTAKGLLGYPPNEKSKSLLNTDVVRMRVDLHTVVTDDTLTISPSINIEIDRTLYDNLVEYEGDKQEPLYLYMWMMQAMAAASNAMGIRKWKGSKIIDLRIVTKKLRSVQTNFGSAKPRVNNEGFAIGGEGLPLYLPAVDNCAQYVSDISRSTKIDENGVYNFADSHLIWANKIILVEWFNDYVMYTDPLGYVATKSLRGVRAMDAASEMMFLNTPIDANKHVSDLITDLVQISADNVRPEEAAALLPKSVQEQFGEDIPTVFSAYSTLLSRGGGIDRTQMRSSFSTSTLAFKHVIGLDLNELRDSKDLPSAEIYSHIVRAYFRALYKKRGKLDVPVFVRLSGLEYMLYAAEKYSDSKLWQKRREEQADYVAKLNANRPPRDTMNFPNLHIGPKNINALLPHQTRYLNAMAEGVSAGIASVATGGGKGLISILDLLQLMEQGVVKRPLLLTKPRLVKENIGEINRISKGKINAVPLRTRMIRHLKNKAGLREAKDFIEWARKLPPNTIFVAAYSDFRTRATLFEELDVPARAMWFDVHLSQMVHLIRLIGIDGVYGDEIHMIKNLKSRLSVCAASVFAGADYTRIASGTLTPNLPKDLVGEMYALNPIIFGDNIDYFENTYHIRGGQVRTDDAARRIEIRMTELSRYFSADEEDWAFVLPTFKDETIYYTLTPLQEEFYDNLLQEAALEMKAKEDELSGKKKASKSDDDDKEDDDEDDDAIDPEDDEDGDGAFIAALNVSLAKVEQFIVAPDMNEQYTSWTKAPKGEDLVSPAVRALDKYLDEHFKSIPKDRWAQEKVLVFSYHKVVSKHFYKHSRWAKSALRYTAGDEGVLLRLKTEDDIVVLFADEGSLREGENLQMCSRVARMQPVWTPGDYKQAAARAYRPDPRGKYAARENVRHTWFIAEGAQGRPTVQGVKLGTMISKTVSNARLKYENTDSFEWRKISPEFDDLKRLRVNFDLVFNTDKNDIDPYMRKWGRFNSWVADRVQKSKLEFAAELERIHNIDLIRNGKIIDVQQFLKLAMTPITSNTNLPGSKRVYTPWEFGANPPDIYDLDLVVLSDQEIRVGSGVMTEFGAALVVDDLAEKNRSIKVELYGGKTITLRRLAVAVPETDAGKKKLDRILKRKDEWKATYISPRVRSSGAASIGEEKTINPKAPSKAQTAPKVPKPKDGITGLKSDDEEPVDIFTQIVNGWPFLAIEADDAPDVLARSKNWNYVAPYVAFTFNSWALADKFLDTLADKFFINQEKFEKLVAEMETMRKGRAMRLISRVKDTEVRSFLLAQHRMKGKSKSGKYVIDPYWVAFGDTVYLAFDKGTHNSAVLSWLKRAAAKVPGIKQATPNNGYYVCQFKSMQEASEGVRQAAKLLNFDVDQLNEELRELKEDIQQFNTRKERPTSGKAAPKVVTKKTVGPKAKEVPVNKKQAGKPMSKKPDLKNKVAKLVKRATTKRAATKKGTR